MDWLFLLQLGVVAAAIILVAVLSLSYARRASRGPEPFIKASLRELQKGWFQVDIAIGNQAPYAIFVEELRRVRPRRARLMAPIKQVNTREGAFQVWTHPSTDRGATSILLNLALGAHDPRGSAVSPAPEGQVTAWLLMPESIAPQDTVLELLVSNRDGHPRRHRFTPQAGNRR